MGGACRKYGKEKRSLQGFGGKTSGKESTLKPRHRWEDNTKILL